MRVALLGSVSSPVPPTGQAAIEKLAFYQAKGLADKGHEVLLFAPVGSVTSYPRVRFVEIAQNALLSGKGSEKEINAEDVYGSSYKLRLELVNLSLCIEKLWQLRSEYDVILSNLRGDSVILPFIRQLGKPFASVLHMPVFPDLARLFEIYNTQLISISNAQRHAFPSLNYISTVYNGVDTSEFVFSESAGRYVLYLGSIGKNKNPKDAIAAAKQAGVKLLIGGRIKDQGYYEKEIAPLVNGTSVEWVGETTPEHIVTLYKGAKAFLFPTMWEEPFGLVMIEALSCGTPVIAYPHGAVPEVIENGKTGFLVSNPSEMAQKIQEIDQINRQFCRNVVEQKFSMQAMVDAYDKVISNMV